MLRFLNTKSARCGAALGVVCALAVDAALAAPPEKKPPVSATPAPAAATPAPAPATPAAAPNAPAPPAETLTPEQLAHKELILDAYRRATALAKAEDFAGAHKVVEEFGAKAGVADPFYDELQGTILAMAKDYVAAQAAFERLLAKTPDSHIGRFNRAEMLLLQSRYAEAEKEFLAVEDMTSGKDPAVADLCRFKRVISLLCVDQVGAAGLLVPPLQENFESPALCYARATLEYAKQNTTKAIQLLEDARTRFSEGVDNLYTDSLVELRWGQRDEAGKFYFKPRLR